MQSEVVTLRELEKEGSARCAHLQHELDLLQREMAQCKDVVPEEAQHELREQQTKAQQLQAAYEKMNRQLKKQQEKHGGKSIDELRTTERGERPTTSRAHLIKSFICGHHSART